MLLKEIQKHEVGDTVTFTIVRDGDILKYDVTLEASKGNATASQDKRNSQNIRN